MRNTKTNATISAPMLTLLALLSFGATTITAAPGDLDPTFGNGGIALVSQSGYQLYFVASMAMQPDGKIVVVGKGAGPMNGAGCTVVRLNSDGSLDTSFGGTGIVINSIGNYFSS